MKLKYSTRRCFSLFALGLLCLTCFSIKTRAQYAAGGGYADGDGVAIGQRANASDGSLALGTGANAEGGCALLFGYSGNPESFAVYGTATGWFSISILASSCAEGDYSMAMGYQAVATGESSMAIGLSSLAAGDNSIALGADTAATGYSSIALGSNVTALGDFSAVFGEGTVASAPNSFVIGSYNIAEETSWNGPEQDALFVVGNGTDPGQESNAFVVRRNGQTTVAGDLIISGADHKVLLPPQGDLSMGTFTAGTPPPGND